MLSETLLHDYEIPHAALQLEAQVCEPILLPCDLGETDEHMYAAHEVFGWMRQMFSNIRIAPLRSSHTA